MSFENPEVLPPGVEEHGGRRYMRDAKDSLIPVETIAPRILLADDTARDLVAKADAMSTNLKAFKERIFADVDAFGVLMFQRYGVAAAGAKGNMSIMSFDGCLKVVVQVQDRMTFGPEVHAAKAIIDELLQEWAADVRPELQALLANAFRADKEGQLNRYAILSLRHLDFKDPRWAQAMQAIADSEKVVGSARYIRFYRKAQGVDAWVNIPLDLANA